MSHFRSVVGALQEARHAFDMDVLTDAHTRRGPVGINVSQCINHPPEIATVGYRTTACFTIMTTCFFLESVL